MNDLGLSVSFSCIQWKYRFVQRVSTWNKNFKHKTTVKPNPGMFSRHAKLVKFTLKYKSLHAGEDNVGDETLIASIAVMSGNSYEINACSDNAYKIKFL